ncbi:hypothetical protein AAFF_G00438080 [Aldrovandia affinis]|uniref:Uncharacterized protein n=1 Tax=Aldrovandia affinis TaxID=143900 RepID=A0AAD7S7R8_9TELE|nr:hypothetical protein AAFF_G00438080 [Aldrovandia affinis]
MLPLGACRSLPVVDPPSSWERVNQPDVSRRRGVSDAALHTPACVETPSTRAHPGGRRAFDSDRIEATLGGTSASGRYAVTFTLLVTALTAIRFVRRNVQREALVKGPCQE